MSDYKLVIKKTEVLKQLIIQNNNLQYPYYSNIILNDMINKEQNMVINMIFPPLKGGYLRTV